MARTTRAPEQDAAPRLTDVQLAEMMGLLRGADTVELKVTVPATSHRATIRGLPLDPVEAQPRQVFFFDTPDLALNAAGLVVRARRIAGGRADTVVKLRPVVPDDLPKEVRRDPAFNVEVDALPGGFVCSASFKGRGDSAEVREAVAGRLPVRRLFSKAQREFYRAHAPEGLELDALVPLGPTFVLKARFPARMGFGPNETERLLVAEMWLYPDGSRILELSTKCAPHEAFQVAADARAYLSSRGVSLAGAQQTKTKTALEFYAAELKREVADAEGAGSAAPPTAGAQA